MLYRAAARSDFRYLLGGISEQRYTVADRNREIRYVDHALIHADSTDKRSPHVSLRRVDHDRSIAIGAQKSVRVSNRKSCEHSGRFRTVGASVSNAFAGKEGMQMRDHCFQLQGGYEISHKFG